MALCDCVKFQSISASSPAGPYALKRSVAAVGVLQLRLMIAQRSAGLSRGEI